MMFRLCPMISAAMGIFMIPIAAQAALFVEINADNGSVRILNDDVTNGTYLGQYILTSDAAGTWSPAPGRWNQLGMDISSGSDQTLQEGQIISDAVGIAPGGFLTLGDPYEWTSFIVPPTIHFTYSVSDTPAGSLTTFENARVVVVPEPTTVVLLAGLGLGLIKARRQRTLLTSSTSNA